MKVSYAVEQVSVQLSEIDEYNMFEDIMHKYDEEIVDVEFDQVYYHPAPDFKNTKNVTGLLCKELTATGTGYFIGIVFDKEKPPEFIRVTRIRNIKLADTNNKILFKLGNDL